MKLTVTTFLSLDGVMQGPGGPEEDPSGGFDLGGWLVPFADEDMGRHVVEWFATADALLLGRTTYEIFASHWPRVTDPNDPVAAAINTLPRYVATRTLETAAWEGTTLLKGDVVEQVRELKDRPGRDLQVHGSAGLLQTLVAHDLVDEYRLFVYPVVLGRGKRLFGSGAVPATMRHVATRTTGAGVTVHTYERAGDPAFGSFALDPS
ncbi:dihydrofolate reductase family protein [Actinoallomurus iriomotensis]|uniref:Deaminase reductase n=1 Tax=Actinoallomurus iriomotensis TaxID=478107 RepID=A0A9W6VSH7_9ACTN|nr:dihydrofolate reductase family protein [Actinoallomurus iriomotensis]GLY77527.1 deaminase reductase [Actinoallomurus iriomotensis]